MTPRVRFAQVLALGAGRPAWPLAATGLAALTGGFVWLSGVPPSEHFVWVFLAIFVAALVSSVAGFAFSAICGAMLFHLIDEPVRAVQIMMMCSACGQALMVSALWREIRWRPLVVFLAGSAIGLPLGLLALVYASPGLYGHAVGSLLLAYALFSIVRPPVVLGQQHPLFDAFVGFLGGITGGAAAFPGAFVTIWCGFKGWTKERQRGLYQPFILLVQVAALAIMAMSSLDSRSTVSFDFGAVAYLPAMLLGSMLGMAFFRRLNDRQFALAVNVLLIASGLSFLL